MNKSLVLATLIAAAALAACGKKKKKRLLLLRHLWPLRRLPLTLLHLLLTPLLQRLLLTLLRPLPKPSDAARVRVVMIRAHA